MKRQKVAAHRCARCGRALQNDAVLTPIGAVGPDCYSKLNGLEQFLELYGLDELAEGPITVPAKLGESEGVWRMPDDLLALERRAWRVGLVLEKQVDWSEEPPLIRAELRVPRSAKGRRTFIHAFELRRRQFEERLKQAGAERRVAA